MCVGPTCGMGGGDPRRAAGAAGALRLCCVGRRRQVKCLWRHCLASAVATLWSCLSKELETRPLQTSRQCQSPPPDGPGGVSVNDRIVPSRRRRGRHRLRAKRLAGKGAATQLPRRRQGRGKLRPRRSSKARRPLMAQSTAAEAFKKPTRWTKARIARSDGPEGRNSQVGGHLPVELHSRSQMRMVTKSEAESDALPQKR